MHNLALILGQMIRKNPWTTAVGIVAILALSWYYQELTPQQMIQFLLIALLGGAGADGKSGAGTPFDSNKEE